MRTICFLTLAAVLCLALAVAPARACPPGEFQLSELGVLTFVSAESGFRGNFFGAQSYGYGSSFRGINGYAGHRFDGFNRFGGNVRPFRGLAGRAGLGATIARGVARAALFGALPFRGLAGFRGRR